jgi:hypothetical protein
MFPGAGAQVYRNEDGEPVGWDYPSRGESEYCDRCGMTHSITFDCEYQEDDDDWEEDE